jgi:hypothetical protein
MIGRYPPTAHPNRPRIEPPGPRALDAADGRIDALQTRLDDNWDSMGEAAREKAQASMKALRERHTEVAE